MTRQYNGPHDLDVMNSELETRMQEHEMNQSGWSMERFIKEQCLYIGFILVMDVILNYRFNQDIYTIYIILIINVYCGV